MPNKVRHTIRLYCSIDVSGFRMNCMKIAGTIINFEIDMSTQLGVRDYSIDYSDYSAYPVVYLSFKSSIE